MYLNCELCKRVTDHKRRDNQSNSHKIGKSVVSSNVFYICPLCNTGVSGTEVHLTIGNKTKSSFQIHR